MDFFAINSNFSHLYSSTFGQVSITFRDENVGASKRIEFRCTKDFLASSGGLFGLFVGASLLSFVELIYFFILRPSCPQQGTRNPRRFTQMIHVK